MSPPPHSFHHRRPPRPTATDLIQPTPCTLSSPPSDTGLPRSLKLSPSPPENEQEAPVLRLPCVSPLVLNVFSNFGHLSLEQRVSLLIRADDEPHCDLANILVFRAGASNAESGSQLSAANLVDRVYFGHLATVLWGPGPRRVTNALSLSRGRIQIDLPPGQLPDMALRSQRTEDCYMVRFDSAASADEALSKLQFGLNRDLRRMNLNLTVQTRTCSYRMPWWREEENNMMKEADWHLMVSSLPGLRQVKPSTTFPTKSKAPTTTSKQRPNFVNFPSRVRLASPEPEDNCSCGSSELTRAESRDLEAQRCSRIIEGYETQQQLNSASTSEKTVEEPSQQPQGRLFSVAHLSAEERKRMKQLERQSRKHILKKQRKQYDCPNTEQRTKVVAQRQVWNAIPSGNDADSDDSDLPSVLDEINTRRGTVYSGFKTAEDLVEYQRQSEKRRARAGRMMLEQEKDVEKSKHEFVILTHDDRFRRKYAPLQEPLPGEAE